MSRSIRIILCMVLVAAFICGIAVCSAEENSFKTPGSVVTFGRYPQTAEGTDETPIEWIVLEYDEANHRALLLSKYGLEAKPYNEGYVDITWEECSLRKWLNNEFMRKAFTQEEQIAILATEVKNRGQGYEGYSYNNGNDTYDYIFLLSYSEANRYLGVEYTDKPGSTQNIQSRVAPTAYAIKRGAYTSSDTETSDGDAAGWWWLRSPGKVQNTVARVCHDGSLYHLYCFEESGSVRPAMWISAE